WCCWTNRRPGSTRYWWNHGTPHPRTPPVRYHVPDRRTRHGVRHAGVRPGHRPRRGPADLHRQAGRGPAAPARPRRIPGELGVAPILRLDGVVAGYGAGDVLRGVDLSLEPGTVTCLIGPNAAGKSTVLKTGSGLLGPSRGAVTFRGLEISALSPRARLLLGIVHVPQERSLFPAMSVWDNLLMGGYVIADVRTLRARAEEAAQAFPICRTRAR